MLVSPVIARRLNHNRQYRIVVSYILVFGGLSVRVPSGFCFDGASIPRVLWRLFHPMQPRFLAAALVHDWLYKIKGVHDWGHDMTRKEVDLLFYHMLRTDGVSLVKAQAMYRGVRAGGWLSFRKKSAEFTEV